MQTDIGSEAERIAKILRVLVGEVDRKLGRQGAMLRYLLDMAHMEARELAAKE